MDLVRDAVEKELRRREAHFYWLSGHDATVAALMAMQVGERAREEAERAKVD
jgi:hypothetical protein